MSLTSLVSVRSSDGIPFGNDDSTLLIAVLVEANVNYTLAAFIRPGDVQPTITLKNETHPFLDIMENEVTSGRFPINISYPATPRKCTYAVPACVDIHHCYILYHMIYSNDNINTIFNIISFFKIINLH